MCSVFVVHDVVSPCNGLVCVHFVSCSMLEGGFTRPRSMIVSFRITSDDAVCSFMQFMRYCSFSLAVCSLQATNLLLVVEVPYGTAFPSNLSKFPPLPPSPTKFG